MDSPPIFQIAPAPGTTGGPCAVGCTHPACVAVRQAAAAVCLLCDSPIGFGTSYVVPTYAPLHRGCYMMSLRTAPPRQVELEGGEVEARIQRREALLQGAQPFGEAEAATRAAALGMSPEAASRVAILEMTPEKARETDRRTREEARAKHAQELRTALAGAEGGLEAALEYLDKAPSHAKRLANLERAERYSDNPPARLTIATEKAITLAHRALATVRSAAVKLESRPRPMCGAVGPGGGKCGRAPGHAGEPHRSINHTWRAE